MYTAKNLRGVVPGCEECRCSRVGSLNDSCDIQSGQCSCKLGVTGRQCDQCERYHWGFSYEGCKGCSCNPEGALDLQCDQRDGQCRCKASIEGQRCDRCVENKYNITLGCLGKSFSTFKPLIDISNLCRFSFTPSISVNAAMTMTMTLAILFSLKTVESLGNGLQMDFGATQLFSMRTE